MTKVWVISRNFPVQWSSAVVKMKSLVSVLESV